MKKILVTGGSGFIGSNLIEYLMTYTQDEVLSLDIASPKINTHHSIWKKVDIRDKTHLSKVIKDFNPNIVIHLAARTDLNGKTIEEYDSNTTGVSNLIEVLNELEGLKRAVFASSMYVCEPGHSPKNFEDYKPHTTYGESKVITEQIIKSADLQYPWAIIRPTSIWGPYFGEPYANFFYIVMSKKYFHMGAKACTKTYGYIDNTIHQILALTNAPQESINKRVFYLGDWPPYDISEWANEIADYIGIRIPRISFKLFQLTAMGGDALKFFGIKFPMTSFRLKNMTTNNIQDLTPIQEIAPNLQVSRRDGVKTTIDWIRKTKHS